MQTISGDGMMSGADCSSNRFADGETLTDQLAQKDAQIQVLERKLQHFRSWMSSIQASVQVINPQALKNSRKLYVGNIPADTTEEELWQFLDGLLAKIGALTCPGNAITSCKLTPDKNYAFIELRNVEETSNALTLDGVAFKDNYLKIKRPSSYDVSTAIMLGPMLPDPSINTSLLMGTRAPAEESPNKIFVGGLPCEWTEEQVKELLTPYGALRSFNLVMDKATGNTKGYAFCEYEDESVTDFAIQSLNQRKANSKVLTVKRAADNSNKPHASSIAPLGVRPAGRGQGSMLQQGGPMGYMGQHQHHGGMGSSSQQPGFGGLGLGHYPQGIFPSAMSQQQSGMHGGAGGGPGGGMGQRGGARHSGGAGPLSQQLQSSLPGYGLPGSNVW